jgi:Polyketide cyclase / dehydrase and lipid transport
MSKTYRAVLAIVVIAAVGYGGWRIYQWRRARAAGIMSEQIVRHGDTWTADFKVQIPAPEKSVFAALEDIEGSHSDQVQNIKVIDQSANSKTVEMTLNGPGGQPIVTRIKFDYDPGTQTISYRTIDNPALETRADYQLADHGSGTLITYHQTTKMREALPVPDGVVKQVIRSIFIAQLDGLKRSLHITTAEQSQDEDD